MTTNEKNRMDFFFTPAGMLIVFIVAFYVITFLVYALYSPGPTENNYKIPPVKNTQELFHLNPGELDLTLPVTMTPVSSTQQTKP